MCCLCQQHGTINKNGLLGAAAAAADDDDDNIGFGSGTDDVGLGAGTKLARSVASPSAFS
jgi:hypothetical protein